MKGSRCRCGFKTTAVRPRCPRCGKAMKAAYWPNQGKVAAYVKLGVVPDGHEFPVDLLMVEVEGGPKIVCWTDTPFLAGDRVTFVQLEEGYLCSPKFDIHSGLPDDGSSEDDVGDGDDGELRAQ